MYIVTLHHEGEHEHGHVRSGTTRSIHSNEAAIAAIHGNTVTLLCSLWPNTYIIKYLFIARKEYAYKHSPSTSLNYYE